MSEITEAQRQAIAAGGGGGAPVVTTLGAPAQTMSVPVDGQGKGLLVLKGKLRNASGSNRNLTFLINGAATNVSMVQGNGAGGIAGSSNGIIGFLRASSVVDFTLTMFTKTGSKRSGTLTMSCPDATVMFATVHAGIHFNDDSTAITSVGIDGGAAGTVDAGSQLVSWEYGV